MKLYVGLDVGLEETSLCVVDSEGQTVRELKVSTEPEASRSRTAVRSMKSTISTGSVSSISDK
jgi:predicted NBD/HSP70 family sugar kinase